jgi:hypothetical protein
MRIFVLIICLIHSFTICSGQLGSVIFNELMIDPDPAVGLPQVEYIELYNRSGELLSLEGWTFYYGEKSYVFSACSIDSAGYCILCSKAAGLQLVSDSPMAVFESFPVLGNTGKMIYLMNENGTLVSSLEYSSGWHENAFKSKGGWSLECIDADNLSGEASNWTSSNDLCGGTPGRMNSVAAVNPDETVPVCTSLYVPSSMQIELTFSKSFMPENLASILNFEILPQTAVVTSALPAFPGYRSVLLNLADSLECGVIYSLYLSNLKDISRISLRDTSVIFGLPESPSLFDLSLNEVLFNPVSGGCDYVEFVNVSQKCVDLSQIWLTNRSDSGTLNEGVRLSEKPLPCVPGSYWLLSVSFDSVVAAKNGVPIPNKIDLPSFPSMPDASGNVVLLTTTAQIIDEMTYNENMHFPLIGSSEGVSLEKLNPLLNSLDQKLWRSASTASDYGTPGLKNSQYNDLMEINNDGFFIQNKWITPNNDGSDDYFTITYQVTEASVANLMVFDLKGRVVRNLIKNELLAASGSIIWDGTSTDGDIVPFGRYILQVEYYTPSGQRNKQCFVLTVLF